MRNCSYPSSLLQALGLETLDPVPSDFTATILYLLCSNKDVSKRSIDIFFKYYTTESSYRGIAEEYNCTGANIGGIVTGIIRHLKRSSYIIKMGYSAYIDSVKQGYGSKEYNRGYSDGYRDGCVNTQNLIAEQAAKKREESERYRQAIRDRINKSMQEEFGLTMEMRSDDMPDAFQGFNLSNRAYNMLRRAGIICPQDILNIGAEGLRGIKGIGKTTYEEVVKMLVELYNESEDDWAWE